MGAASPAELAQRCQSEEPITVLDVRGRSYRSRERKIEGAVRIDPRELLERYRALPHDGTIVAYEERRAVPQAAASAR